MCSLFTWFNLQILIYSVNEDIWSLHGYQPNVQRCVIVKISCFIGLPLIHNSNKKNHHFIIGTFTNKNALQNFKRFQGNLFDLDILDSFTAGFFVKAII